MAPLLPHFRSFTLALLALTQGASCFHPTSKARPSQPRLLRAPSAFSAPVVSSHPSGSRSLGRRRLFNWNSNNDEYDDALDDARAGGGDARVVDPLILEVSRSLRRLSFFSWWSQVILSTVSAVILVFAKNVLAAPGGRATVAAGPNLILSGPGLLLSAASILWTWGSGARLSRRLVARPTARREAAALLRRAVRVGTVLNMLGLLGNLLAAEQIVGGLAVKVLTMQAAGAAAGTWAGAGLQGLQPLDILVVQANTNSLLSHFLSLASLLLLTDKIHKLRGGEDER